MKQVQMVEITSFIETALQYFQHVSEAIKNEVSNLLEIFIFIIYLL